MHSSRLLGILLTASLVLNGGTTNPDADTDAKVYTLAVHDGEISRWAR